MGLPGSSFIGFSFSLDRPDIRGGLPCSTPYDTGDREFVGRGLELVPRTLFVQQLAVEWCPTEQRRCRVWNTRTSRSISARPAVDNSKPRPSTLPSGARLGSSSRHPLSERRCMPCSALSIGRAPSLRRDRRRKSHPASSARRFTPLFSRTGWPTSSASARPRFPATVARGSGFASASRTTIPKPSTWRGRPGVAVGLQAG